LSDQFGRRKIFLCGIVVFTTASLLCGFATNIYILIVFRGLQAIGGGTLQPSAAGIVSDLFGRDRDRAIGLFGTIAASGQVAGPVLGGVLVGYLSWRWIFFVNVPIGIVLVVLVFKFIPESLTKVTAKTDVRGLLLTGALVLTAIYGISSLGSGNTAIYDPTFLVPMLCALGLLWQFIRHTKRTPTPFIPIRLLSDRGFAAVNIQNLLFGAATFGAMSLVPLYAEQRYHLQPLNAGTLLTARAVGAMAVGVAAAMMLRRTGYRRPMIIGFVINAVALLAMSIAPRLGISPYVWLSSCAALAGLGVGISNPASRNAGLQLAPESVAAITGLRSMFTNLGIIFSVSVTTAILNRSSTPGLTQAHIFWVVAGIIVMVMVPLTFRVPEHKGTW
jgi:EmrB/QacA subfamily drug resistance transporter